ncbi:MAG: hypothetical protein OEZ15_01045 [Gammaproteobacteria bacterium]|nr:hypothetical protein [Gammaproteobacteria bacterium]
MNYLVIEVYTNECSINMGLSLWKRIKAGVNKFGYHLGWLFALDDNAVDHLVKVQVVYEFKN